METFGLKNPVLKIFHGAQATEAGVLADLDALLDYGAADLAEEGKSRISVAEPVRVVVPSRGLRDHLARRYLQHRGRPALGLNFQTLQGLSLEILQRGGEAPPRGKELFSLLVERFAREEPELRRQLDSLVDGYLPVEGTVRDLVDAGLEEGLLEAAQEALGNRSGSGLASRAAEERAQALLRVAGGVVQAMGMMGVGRPSDASTRARRLLEMDPAEALPARAILIHGYADATGKTADLLEALVQYRAARIYLDHPPMPHGGSTATAMEVEASFPRRLRERLESAGATVELAEAESLEPSDRTPFQLLEAPDPEAEVRAAAGWVRGHLQREEVPEDLAIVARDLKTYEGEIWRCFHRLGIPFSFRGDHGSATEEGRATEGVLDLLRLGARTPVDRWLQVAFWSPLEKGPVEETTGEQAARRVELRLALHSLGVGRLEEIVGLDLEPIRRRGGVTLPNLQVSAEWAQEEAQGEVKPSRRSRRRKLPVQRLEDAVTSAAALLEILEGWPPSAPLSDHFGRFLMLLKKGLGWTGELPDQGLVAEVEKQQGRLQEFGPLEISQSELHRLLAGILETAGRSSLGGKAGGVHVLTVTEARGRTFGHLLILGMNRGQMPRPVREDPLLPDVLRRRLMDVLPDIPLKSRGFDEERYLFAQLASAAGSVTLARHASNHDGRPVPPSPLLARLQAEAAGRVVVVAAQEASPRPAAEHALTAGLVGHRSQVWEALPVVTAEAGAQSQASSQVSSQAWSHALVAVLDELDPDLRTAEGRLRRSRLGPFLGLLGPVPGVTGHKATAQVDPRAGQVWVTHLEGVAACPWQTFLRRLLRVESSPDPLQALPDLTPLLLGKVVHGMVERIVVARLGSEGRKTLAQLQGRPPEPIPWPDGKAFEEMLSREVEEALAEEGIGLSLLAEPLMEQARPLLDQVRELLWAPSGGDLAAFGAEILGEAMVPASGAASSRSVAFRADLVVTAGNDASLADLKLVDLKTGRSPISSAKGEGTRRKHLLQDIRRGGKLQGAAYALAEGATVGEYLFVHPDLRGEHRAFPVEKEDGDAAAAFAAAAETTLDAWEAGTFFPRLVDPRGQKEPDRCKTCEVAEACLRGDSGIRARLVEVSEGLTARLATVESLRGEDLRDDALRDDALRDEERAFLDLWRLPEAEL